MTACNEGSFEAVRLLLDARAPIGAADDQGFTPLHTLLANQDLHSRLATGAPSEAIFAALLEADANVNARNKLGFSALVYLARGAAPVNCLRTLIKRGAKLCIRDNCFGFDAYSAK